MRGKSGTSIQGHVEAFRAFVQEYMTGDPEHDRNIRLKEQHTYGVLDNAERIVPALELSGDMAETAVLAALFHDAGRFPQFSTYGTYKDALSENHAILGVKILKTSGLLDGLETLRRKRILGIVALHNKRTLPPGADPEVLHLTRIVRDADKIDIIRVMVEHFQRGNDLNPKVTLNVKEHPTAYTASIYDSVVAGQVANYLEMEWLNDFKLLLCGWVDGLNFGVSKDLLRQRGLMEDLMEQLPATAEMDVIRQRTRQSLAG